MQRAGARASGRQWRGRGVMQRAKSKAFLSGRARLRAARQRKPLLLLCITTLLCMIKNTYRVVRKQIKNVQNKVYVMAFTLENIKIF